MLDMEASSLEQITDLVLDNMINKGTMPFEVKDKVNINIILKNFENASMKSIKFFTWFYKRNL